MDSFRQPKGNKVNSDDRKIWWLASYPKSGNTWVRMFLNAYVTKFSVDINSAYQFVSTDLRPEIFQMMSPRPLSEMSVREQFIYYPAAIINLLKLTNTRDACIKTHNAKVTVEGSALINPYITGGAVYIIRDPRDVAISSASHFNKNLDDSIEALCESNRIGRSASFGLCHMFMSWEENVKSWCVANKNVNVLIIKYEDLVSHTEKAFNSIIKHMGLECPDHDERMSFALKESNFKNLQKKEKETGFNEKAGGDQFFRKGTVGQWRDILNKGQKSVIEHKNKAMMKKYGYL